MLQIHCCNGKVNMINLNTKSKHGETAYHCVFKEGQFEVISESLRNQFESIPKKVETN